MLLWSHERSISKRICDNKIIQSDFRFSNKNSPTCQPAKVLSLFVSVNFWWWIFNCCRQPSTPPSPLPACHHRAPGSSGKYQRTWQPAVPLWAPSSPSQQQRSPATRSASSLSSTLVKLLQRRHCKSAEGYWWMFAGFDFRGGFRQLFCLVWVLGAVWSQRHSPFPQCWERKTCLHFRQKGRISNGEN